MAGQADSDDADLLDARGVTFAHTAMSPRIGPLDLSVRRGELVGVLGPNGAGKSTLLRLVVGLLRPQHGEISIAGQRLSTMSPAARARLIAFLPQNPEAPAAATVEEIVRLGRHPHRGWSIFESPHDLEVVQAALARTGTSTFAARRLDTLSGGEAQRVHLAAALAQEPKLLVLDEPTANLDLHQQLKIFTLLAELTRNEHLAVLVVTHDLNLSAQFCDRVVVLRAGQMAAVGPPAAALRRDVLTEVYGVRFHEVALPGRAVPGLLALEPSEGVAS
jgi:iron complex transport system ATP-binding protein